MSDINFSINQDFSEGDLLDPGERVNPEAIADGLFYEIAVGVNGEVRHLPLFTAKGVEVIGAQVMAAAERGEFPLGPDGGDAA